MKRSPHAPERLTVEEARSLFDAMDVSAEPDFSLIERFYHPDVHFQDPIQKLPAPRDYFDLWGDSLAAMPVLGAAYRRFMHLLG